MGFFYFKWQDSLNERILDSINLHEELALEHDKSWLSEFSDWVRPEPDEVKAMIKGKGLTQNQFGELTGISPKAVQNYCCSKDLPSYRPIPYSVWRLAMHELGYLS